MTPALNPETSPHLFRLYRCPPAEILVLDVVRPHSQHSHATSRPAIWPVQTASNKEEANLATGQAVDMQRPLP